MTKVKVIIKPSCGVFEPRAKLARLLKEEGVSLFSIEGRTNPRIIQYVEENGEYGHLQGKNSWSVITIREADTSEPWTIGEYDGAEYIEVIDYKVVDKKINYVEKKH